VSTPEDLVPDPRARWLVASLWLLFQEFAPADQPVGISVQALSGDQLVTYGLNAGSSEIIRFIADADDLAGAAEALEAAFAGVVTDATVPDGPP
jgi:hypothetical protein